MHHSLPDNSKLPADRSRRRGGVGRTQPRNHESGAEVSNTTSVRFPHSVVVRICGLLPMLYSPRELGEELRISPRTIRDLLSKGMPHQRDQRGHIWIDGKQFADWVNAIRRSKTRQKMADDEAFCFRCNAPARMLEKRIYRRGKHIRLSGKCTQCGGNVSRGGHDG